MAVWTFRCCRIYGRWNASYAMRNCHEMLHRGWWVEASSSRYLVDRGIVSPETLPEFGDLRRALGEHRQAYRLFDWVRSTFNGDLFPVLPGERGIVQGRHLELVSETLAGVDPESGQGSLWGVPVQRHSDRADQLDLRTVRARGSRRKGRGRKRCGPLHADVGCPILCSTRLCATWTPTRACSDLTCGLGSIPR